MNKRMDFMPGRAGVEMIQAAQMSVGGGRQAEPDCLVVSEDVLTIEVEEVGSYALMWTPTEESSGAAGYTIADGILTQDGVPEALALATGFAFTEGIINALSDIASMWICPERPDVVRLRLTRPDTVAVRRRDVVVNSSCGICGGREQLENDVTRRTPATDDLRLTLAELAAIRAELQGRQSIFARTGGAHGAAIFDGALNVLAIAEDIGRHNALDKVIGHCLLRGIDLSGCGAFISSRISYEMAAKAVRAGFEILAAISAPSSLAIDLAAHHGLTLCGFVRGDTAMIYTHPQRIVTQSTHDGRTIIC